MILTEPLALALWQRALGSEIGIAITVTPETKTIIRDFLYEAKRNSHQLALDAVIMVLPGPHPEEIWLAKKAVEL